ncbi:hypothetical protein SESBI_12572 [Sesbania bispinosa]|nr:hypothetical protein SESBI_12572 [Sesbania bispinosa]
MLSTMSQNASPVASEDNIVRGEALTNVTDPSNQASSIFPWVDSSVLTRTSVLLSPESLLPFRNLVRTRFPEVSKFWNHLQEMRTEETSELLFNTLGEPKFPFYWTKNPNRLRGHRESSLTDLELVDVKLLASFYPVNCSVLIENEGDAGALQPYIVEMSSKKEGFVPQMDAKAMRAFSRTNKRKQGSQPSGLVLLDDAEHEVSSSTISDKLVNKKACANKDPTSSSAQPTPNVESSQPGSSNRALLITPSIPKWWHWFQGFEGQPGSATQKLKEQEAEVAKAREVTSELKNLQEKFQNFTSEKEKLEDDLAGLKNEKEKTDALLSEKSKLLEAAEERLLAEQDGRKEDANRLKAEISFQYEQGFEKAIDQVKFLHPRIDVGEVGAFKEIVDGKLIDIPDDEE